MWFVRSLKGGFVLTTDAWLRTDWRLNSCLNALVLEKAHSNCRSHIQKSRRRILGLVRAHQAFPKVFHFHDLGFCAIIALKEIRYAFERRHSQSIPSPIEFASKTV